MAKQQKSGIKHSAVRHALRTPMFRQRVVRDRTKYTRKGRDKHMSQ